MRCCSHTQLAGWTRLADGCPYAESELEDVCLRDGLAFQDAAGFCRGVGGRLCTLDEVQRGCTRGTSCPDDSALIWTSSSTAGVSVPA